jgi:hypothetical protein
MCNCGRRASAGAESKCGRREWAIHTPLLLAGIGSLRVPCQNNIIIALVNFGVHRSVGLGNKECSISIDVKYLESAGRGEKNDTAICAFCTSFPY